MGWGSDTEDLADMLTKAAEAARAGNPEPGRRFNEAMQARFPKRGQPVSDTNWTAKVDRIFLAVGLLAVAVVAGLLLWWLI